MVGVASYRKTCFEKIMALENSFLASQVREHFDGWSVVHYFLKL